MNDLILEYFFEVVSQTILHDGVIYAPLGLTVSHCTTLILVFGFLFGAAAFFVYELCSLFVTLFRLLYHYFRKRKKADPSNT